RRPVLGFPRCARAGAPESESRRPAPPPTRALDFPSALVGRIICFRSLGMNSTTRETLGPYQIIGPLGAGGMGEVYVARDPSLGRTVAIKVLPHRFSSDRE